MMKSIRLGLVTLLTVAVGYMANAQGNLDPAFRVIKVNGDCQVGIAGTDGFVPAEESKAYPYGSTIRTGGRSSLVVVLSEGNVVRVLANADLVMDENARDSKIKTVRLHDGEIEVELNKAFHRGGNKLNVETATAICGAVGTHFRVASREEQDLRIVIIRVIQGVINVYGENFEVAELDTSDWLSLLSPGDRSFLRLKNMQGEFDIRIKDQDMNDKNLPTQKGNVMKIWQRSVPGTNERVITAQLTDPTGTIIEEVTVTIGGDQPPPFVGDLPIPGQDEPIPPIEDRENPLPPESVMNDIVDRQPDEDNIEHGRTTPRPPSPTPVGRR